MSRIPFRFALTLLLLLSSQLPGLTSSLAAQRLGDTPAISPGLSGSSIGLGWPTYGGDPGGLRFSSSTQINRSTLPQLRVAWIVHTHALDSPRSGSTEASFEATPVLSGDTLYLTSPFDIVLAIDAVTGSRRWAFDPHLGPLATGDLVTSRGVALWHAPSSQHIAPPLPCASRVFFGTLDARLFALDAATGRPCPDFGTNGRIDLRRHRLPSDPAYGVSSPPTILGNAVIVGSLVGDNQQVQAPSGVVRAFDARSGRLLWSWEPLPWARTQAAPTGAANTWSVISADPALGLVYLPTGSPSPDYFGGLRPGDDRDADSLVALNAVTGQKLWAFQVVHHDLWDYDIAAQPLLFTFHGSDPTSTPIPAVAIATKMGLVFVLDRRSGIPLLPVQERPVPQTDVPGETTSPTQPIPTLPALDPLSLAASSPPSSTAWRRSPASRQSCLDQIAHLRYDGLYTPPSIRGSLVLPGNLGGVNWGSAAFDPTTGVLYANTNRVAFSARLIPRYGREMTLRLLRGLFFDWANWGIAAGVVLLLGLLHARLRRHTWHPGPMSLAATGALMLVTLPIAHHQEPSPPTQLAHFGYELSPQSGTPYLIERRPLLDPEGLPCTPTPWGALTALNLNTGRKLWESPLGTRIPGQATGTINFGGPIVTAAGLVFTAAAEDAQIRAFDAQTGALLWQAPLPASAQSTPMTYTLNGRQFLVVAAGGHGDRSGPLNDTLVAFALPLKP